MDKRIAYLIYRGKKLKLMENRTIKLSKKKAKEWYKKGGELKEVALQAYNEEELKDFKYTWENCYSAEGSYYVSMSVGGAVQKEDSIGIHNLIGTTCASKKYAKSTQALIKLTHVVKKLNEDFPQKERVFFHPYWQLDTQKLAITFSSSTVYSALNLTSKDACDILIRDNKQLLLDYFMVEEPKIENNPQW